MKKKKKKKKKEDGSSPKTLAKTALLAQEPLIRSTWRKRAGSRVNTEALCEEIEACGPRHGSPPYNTGR